MSLNNTPFKFNNQTKFVPAKPPEFTNTMTTYERLDTAEKELRSALGSVTGTASAIKLRKLLNIIEDIEDMKRSFVGSNETPNFVITTPDSDGGVNTVDYGYGAAGPVDFPSPFGQDVITFS
jgi:hypothetical protein